ncbi:MAG: hypothetical protein FE78DRAFT_372629 [Acidomyces sp. 'richmondensis']|nr:MAG: hypothetical protein FE78DRAFT_372629 [Acidomyces sp. 'richmondensis']
MLRDRDLFLFFSVLLPRRGRECQRIGEPSEVRECSANSMTRLKCVSVSKSMSLLKRLSGRVCMRRFGVLERRVARSEMVLHDPKYTGFGCRDSACAAARERHGQSPPQTVCLLRAPPRLPWLPSYKVHDMKMHRGGGRGEGGLWLKTVIIGDAYSTSS